MSAFPSPSILSSASPAQAGELALRLAHAEQALRALTLGQADAIVDADGQTYLLRPAQERLRENERRLQTLLAGMPDAVMVVSRTGFILSSRGAAQRVLGRGRADFVGGRFFDYVHADDVSAVHAAFFGVVEGLKPFAMVEFSHRADDGTYRLVEATLGSAQEAGEACVLFNLRPCDGSRMAHVKSDQRELASAKAALGKDRFLAILSHELRTPLTPMLLGIYELEQDARFPEARETLALIRRCLAVESRLLDELIDFTTLGQHKVRLRLSPQNVHEAISFVLKICESDLVGNRIEIHTDLQAPEHWVMADADRLQQIMWNLVKNAVKFSPRASHIFITTANEEAGQLTIAIRDEGVGIEPALLPLVFEPYQQGDQAQQRRSGGLGLGLFIAREMATLQGGTLAVASAGSGCGTTFRLTFPTTEAPLVRSTS